MTISPDEHVRIHDEALFNMCQTCKHKTIDCRHSCDDYLMHMKGLKRAKEQKRHEDSPSKTAQ